MKCFDFLKQRFPEIKSGKDLTEKISVRSFQEFDEETDDHIRHLVNLCMQTEPEFIDSFGKEFLYWLDASFPYSTSNSDRFEEFVCEKYDLPDELFDHARMSFGHKSFTCAQLIKAIELAQGVDLEQLDLQTLLKANQINDLPEGLSLDKFSLSPIRLNTVNCVQQTGKVVDWYTREERTLGDRYYDLYMDSPSGLLLSYDGHPAAILGAQLNNDGVLVIKQFQGVNPYQVIDGEYMHQENGEWVANKKLKAAGIFDKKQRRLVFDIRKLLVEVGEAWAQIHGIDKIMIQSGENNFWVVPRFGEDEAHLDLKRAQDIYDKTAGRLGYDFDEQSRNWIKSLST